MTNPSTSTDDFAGLIHSLGGDASHYYIKHPSIVEKIDHNGRIFYSKYERVDQKLTNELISKHLNRTLTIGIPLVQNGKAEQMVFFYDGNAPERFAFLFEHLMNSLGMDNYHIFKGENQSIKIATVKAERQNVSDIYSKSIKISDMLEKKLTKNWKILPDPSLPESYNILTIPYIN